MNFFSLPIRSFRSSGLKLFLLLALAGPLSGQPFRNRIPPEDQATADRQAAFIFQALRPVTKPVGEFCYAVLDGRKTVCHAVSLGEEKFLTKWSDIAKLRGLSLLDRKNGSRRATPVAVYPEHDLAVIQVPGLMVEGVPWATGKELQAGTFLAAVDPAGEAQALGVVSVPERSLREEDQGFLGIQMANRQLEEGVAVEEVVPDSAADQVGVRKGDIVTRVNGHKVNDTMELMTRLRTLKAGREAEVELLRNRDRLILRPVLTGRQGGETVSRQVQRMNAMSGTQSLVRDEFPQVIQSDMELEAWHAGMPVVDLDGDVVGMVIARASRISTFVLPASLIANELKTEPHTLRKVRKGGREGPLHRLLEDLLNR